MVFWSASFILMGKNYKQKLMVAIPCLMCMHAVIYYMHAGNALPQVLAGNALPYVLDGKVAKLKRSTK